MAKPIIPQIIQIPLGKGIDTKLDPKLGNGQLLTLENGSTNKTTGTVNKRYGYKALSRSVIGSGSIISGSGITTFGDELVLFADNKLYSFNSSSNNWAYKGNVTPIQPAAINIIEADETAASLKDGYGCAYTNGIIVNAWKNGSSNIYAEVIDEKTKNILLGPIQLRTSGGSTCYHPKCVALSSTICVLWDHSVSGEIRMRTLDTNNIGAGFTAENQLIKDLSASAAPAAWDILPWNDISGAIAYSRNADMCIRPFTALTASVITRSFEVAKSVGRSLTLVQTSDKVFNVGYCISGSASGSNIIQTVGFNADSTLSVAYGIKVIPAVEASASSALTGIAEGTGYRLFWEKNAVAGKEYLTSIRNCLIASGGVVGTPADFATGVGLASKAFSYKGNTYVNVCHESTLQCTYATLDATGSLINIILPGKAGSVSTFPNLQPLNRFSQVAQTEQSGNFYWLGLAQIESAPKTPSVAGVATYTSEALIKLDFSSSMIPQGKTIANILEMAAGGLMYDYDGQIVTEHDFVFFPENITTSSSITGGNLIDGVYTMYFTNAWYDSQARIHESFPSNPVVVTLAGGGSSQLITATVPTPNLTNKTTAVVRLYRTPTEDDPTDSTAYYDTEQAIMPLGFTTIQPLISIQAGSSANNIQGNAPLTTVGDNPIVASISPTSSKSLVTKGDRLFSYDGQNNIWYSKKQTTQNQGEGIVFNDLEVITLDPSFGDDYVLGTLNANIVILNPKKIFYLYGDGPSNLGGRSEFSEALDIPADEGAFKDSPVAETHLGLIYIGQKGPQLLTQNREVQDIGQPVYQYQNQTFTSIDALPDQQQIRISAQSGSMLVYSYNDGQWSTFTNLSASDATVWKNQYTILSTDGLVMVENSGSFQDNGNNINMVAQTRWLQVGQLDGFQRPWWLNIIGQFKSQSNLKLTVYKDYNETAFGTHTYNIQAGSTIGDILLARHFLGFPCKALKFKIEDVSQGGTGESFNLTMLELEVGIRQQNSRLGTPVF